MFVWRQSEFALFSALTSVGALFYFRGDILKTIVNILAFAVLGLLLFAFIGNMEWAIENGIYKIVGILVIIAAILKGIITIFGSNDSENE